MKLETDICATSNSLGVQVAVIPGRHDIERNMDRITYSNSSELIVDQERILSGGIEALYNGRFLSYKLINGNELELELIATSPDDSIIGGKRRLRLEKSTEILMGISIYDRPLASDVIVLFASKEGLVYKVSLKYGLFLESVNENEKWLQIYCLHNYV